MAKKENEIKEKKQKNSYFKEMKAELKKVVWPTPKELVNNTIAVIGFVLIIAIIVFIFDFCFDNLNKYGITTLQDKVISYLEPDEDLDGEDENVESNESAEGNNDQNSEASGEEDQNNEAQDSEANGEESQNNEVQNSEANGEENQNNENQESTEGESSSEE